MRRIAPLLLLALLARAEGRNLLANGGFETGTDGWVFFQFGPEDQQDLERKGAPEGKQALHVKKKGRKVALVWTDYALAGRQGKLRFSLRAKGKRLDRTEVWFIVWDAAGDAAVQEKGGDRDLKGTFKWKTLEKTLPIPAGAKGGRVLVKLFGDGELWLDDAAVTLEGAAPETPLEVRNGDFAKNVSEWGALGESVRADGDHGTLRLERGGPRLYPEDGVEQRVALPDGARKVTLRCRARAKGAARACVVLLAETGTGAFVACARAETGADAFEELAVPLDVPADARRLRICLALRGAGPAWFDDVRLEEG